jgi:hypothetical protein
MIEDIKKLLCDKQRLTVALCFMLFVINTQIKQTLAWDSPVINASFHTTELIMSFVILSYYRLSDILKHKRIYIIYSVAGLIAGIAFICIRFRTEFHFRYPAVIIMVAGLFMLGICAISTIIYYIVDKNKLTLNRPAFAVWFLLMVLMSVSAGDFALYALRFFICFLMYYLAPHRETTQKSITEGMVIGLVLGYLFEFGFCLLFRPYDIVRYMGNFSNPNHNCLFLDFVLAALLGGLLLTHHNGCKRIVSIFLYILIGTDLACIYMTASRSGWLGAFFVFALYIVFYVRITGKKFLKHICFFAMIFLLGLPLTYVAIRYMPLSNPYVKFYFFDNHNYHTVHRENKYDQSNYIGFKQMLLSPLGRFSVILESNDNVSEEVVEITEEYTEDVQADNSNGALLTEESSDPVLVRYTIHKWYFEHLTLRGVPADEQGFQLTPDHYVQDAHNIFLSYGADYGFPAMIMFIVLILYSEVYCIVKALKQKDVIYAISAMMIIISPVVGMFEYAWGYGLISMIIPYFCMKNVVVKTAEKQA